MAAAPHQSLANIDGGALKFEHPQRNNVADGASPVRTLL
jgi:hypothetical protein